MKAIYKRSAGHGVFAFMFEYSFTLFLKSSDNWELTPRLPDGIVGFGNKWHSSPDVDPDWLPVTLGPSPVA